MSGSRLRAVEDAFNRGTIHINPPAKSTSEYYGCNVFSRKNMRRYLSADTRQKIYESIERGTTLSREVADHVAEGMKRWAMDMGATHYTHWFQPLTGGTAEKHDSFAEPYGKDESLEQFAGKLLCQQEPDASSFPSGGIRNTFEARGYTAWDPSSPAFIIGDCLCIPTVFISYTGEALDFKAPLLKSQTAVSKAAEDFLNFFGINNIKVFSYLGWEQEFFLIDAALYAQRPDLVMTGRTLVGHNSAKNQQLEDHYLGTIPERVIEFMKDLEIECYKLGMPIKTRHNEVAPNQFEIAPVFERVNLANDHNLILMALMRKVAERHKFEVLFHEKPFNGVNGSGKHCNWSLGTESGMSLMQPGKMDIENLRFLSFISNVLKAVYDNNALLKASVLTVSNIYRLGANEAPPTIISSFLGKQVTDAFNKLLNSKSVVEIKDKSGYNLNIPQIPELLMDNTDRNRTSPFAFTGNRFEFRAVGSSANCAQAITVLNTILANQLNKFNQAVNKRIMSGQPTTQALLDETRNTYRACRDVCFDGNGYSDDWKIEAAHRGLDCETSIPVVLDVCTLDSTISLYRETGVMSSVELKARYNINLEIYCKKVEIEARVLSELVVGYILPASIKYQSILLDNVSKMKSMFPNGYMEMTQDELQTIRDINDHKNKVHKLVLELNNECDKTYNINCERDKAMVFCNKIVPYLSSIREHIDALEMIVDDSMWPLPKYRELLFIH